jgi:hypothetical protein
MKGLFVTRSITALCIKCHYAECRDLFVMLNAVMLSIVLLSVVLLSVVLLNVILLSVVLLSVVLLNVVLLSVVVPFSLIISHSFYSW